MQLCAAQLLNCGVLMRIEPTGHLDVDYIRWLKDWLESFAGNMLTMFVRSTRRKGVLRNGLMKFAFVKPGLLEDVKSRKLAHDERELQYPSKDRPTIVNVNLTVSQVSRVAVVSTNGARKSTVSSCPLRALFGRPQVLEPCS